MASIFANVSTNLENAFASPTDSSLNLLRLLFGLLSTLGFLQAADLSVGGVLLTWEKFLQMEELVYLEKEEHHVLQYFPEGGASRSSVFSNLTGSYTNPPIESIVHAWSSATSVGNFAPN